MAPTITPGALFPSMAFSLVDGSKKSLDSGSSWTLLIVYRGRHCARCKTYLSKLDGLLPRLADLGVETLVVSADPVDRARADAKDFGWRFPLAHGLTVEQMRQLGLFVSDSLSDKEPGHPFAEPGLFVINGEGRVQVVAISNSASVRPDLDVVVDGIGAMQAKALPVRGLAA